MCDILSSEIFRFTGYSSLLCPHLRRNHSFFAFKRWEEVLLAQEVQWEMDQDALDGLQFFFGFLRVSKTEVLSIHMFLKLTQVADAVQRKTSEDLYSKEKIMQYKHWPDITKCIT